MLPSPRLPLGLLLAGALAAPAGADDSPAPRPDRAARDLMPEIRPNPPVGIPADPPPHEGAMIDFPLTIEPPDLIIVEVLVALPGRPITGERLVRPDGTISLGFYGDVHVRGLTPRQAKVKIVHHLRQFLNDDLLGLTVFHADGVKLAPLPRPGTKVPMEMTLPPRTNPFEKPDAEPPIPPAAKPAEPPAPGTTTASPPRSSRARRDGAGRPRRRLAPTARAVRARQDAPIPTGPEVAVLQDEVAGVAEYIDPADSVRVFLDLAAHNSRVYHVLGDVGSPGRLPVTGKETVLDAISYAGGLVPTAEPTDIHLYRPARGDMPAQDHRIDYPAILKGDAKANLQLFPGDRLVVGRNPIVRKTIEIDRAAAVLQSILASYTRVNAARSARSDEAGQGKIRLGGWFNILWGELADPRGALQDPDKFRDLTSRWLDRIDPGK